MSSRTRLYREVYRLIEQKLCAQGMRKYEQGIYGRELTVDARGMVGLNVATNYGFELNPLIGVQYLRLEHVLAQMKEREFHTTACGDTITSPIGYLGVAKRFRTWDFEEGRDNEATVADMVHEITTVGFRYMEENCTLEKICERLAVERHFMMGNDIYHLPVGYMMLGRFDDAEKVVRDHLAKIAGHKPRTIEEIEANLGEKLDPRALERLEKTKDDPIPAHESYRRFAERFFRRLEEERSRSSTQ
jgi:hypothetical protein